MISYFIFRIKDMKKHIVTMMLVGGMCLGAFAQSNELIDSMLAQERASIGKAAYLVLLATGTIPETAKESEAAQIVADKPWNLAAKSAEEPITLGQYSFLIMQAFGIPGGMMYSLFPCPRYAVRSLAFLGIVSGKAEEWRYLTGDEAFRILTKALAWKEARS